MSFGIDFGTTNSVLAHFDGEQSTAIQLDSASLEDWSFTSFENLFPTVVGYSMTQPEWLFGWNAKLQANASFPAVKRLLKGDERVRLAGLEFTAPTVVAGFFDALRSRASGKGLAVDRAVVTVPANATGAARYRTRAAARVGGVQVQALVNEPTAAAIAYLHDLGDDLRDMIKKVLVFDWGGGTVDVTILEYDAEFGLFQEQASRGVTELGGLDLDARLERLVLRKIGGNPGWSHDELRDFRLQIERTKILLSTEDFADLDTPDYSKTITVERTEFESEIANLIARSSEPLMACLSDLRLNPSELDAVLMIGGSSQIPLVRERIKDILGADEDKFVDPEICDPMTAVAQGAAIAAAILDGELTSTLSVASTHALGIASKKDGKKRFSEIIPRNAALPRVEKKLYRPSEDGSSFLLEVVEGDADKPLDDPENFLLAAVVVALPPNRTREENAFELTYSYDTNGLLHVEAETLDGILLLDEEIDKFGIQESGAAVTSESLQAFLRALRQKHELGESSAF